VDVFKRLSNVSLARAADVQARIQLVEVVKLSLSVSVAETYFGIVEQRQLLALLAKQKDTSTELLRIIERRYEQGLSSRLDVLQQQSQLAEIVSQMPTAESALQDLINQIGVLLSGLPGSEANEGLGTEAAFPTVPSLERLGRPDELLNRRPDLRAAQADLVAADADTARALAERLPRLTFSADALLIEGRGPDGHLVTLGAGLVQPLLDWGQRRSEWVRAQAVYRERMANFSQAYLRAVWSVETVVQNEAKQKELLKRLQERKELLDATLGLATRRYTSGLTDYLPVLTAMQQLYALEQRLIREERRLTSLRISLHQALGGPVTPVEAPSNKPSRPL
jgi:outer membrane protein TolC